MASHPRLGRSKKGQAVLPLVFLMGGLVVLMALTLAFLAHSFLQSSYGFQLSERAKAVAASGVYDALLRLARDKDLSGAYSVPLGDYSANVVVTQDLPFSGQVKIVSTGAVSNRERKITAITSRSPSTGQIILISWQYTQ